MVLVMSKVATNKMKELQKFGIIVWFSCICVFCKNELEFDIFESTIPAKNVTNTITIVSIAELPFVIP